MADLLNPRMSWDRYMKSAEVYHPAPEPLKCKNCGAPLTADGRCEYCGAHYHITRDAGPRVCIELARPRVVPLEATMRIDRAVYEHWPDDFIAGQVIQDMRQQFADQLAAFIRLDRNYDLQKDMVMIRGRLRVVEPDFRF